jgi:putative acetyltransferase
MSLKPISTQSYVRIRVEDSGSIAERQAIRVVNELAFGGLEEADLIDQLRAGGHSLLSLVAESEAGIVGHILFSRMWIKTEAGHVAAVALAPMAVLPEYQRRGIGQRLVERGLEGLRNQQERIVIVVGHPAYYPRFGFSAAKAALLEGPYPREALMAMELAEGALASARGRVVYPPAFGI